jgi:hypothetical protein
MGPESQRFLGKHRLLTSTLAGRRIYGLANRLPKSRISLRRVQKLFTERSSRRTPRAPAGCARCDPLSTRRVRTGRLATLARTASICRKNALASSQSCSCLLSRRAAPGPCGRGGFITQPYLRPSQYGQNLRGVLFQRGNAARLSRLRTKASLCASS